MTIKPYKYNENLMLNIVNELNSRLRGNKEYENQKLTKGYMSFWFENLKNDVYLIQPNPVDDTIKFLVFDANDRHYFFKIDKSKNVGKHLRKLYSNLDEDFRRHKSLKSFFKQLDNYEENEVPSNNILLSDGYIYDFEDLEFKKEVYELPAFYRKNKYVELKESDKGILDKMFNMMYPQELEQKQFFYYVLCCLNKNYAQQRAFLIIDPSGVGKTAKINPMASIGLTVIADSRLLEKSELYNIAFKNSILFNESQLESLNGSTISLLVDTMPLMVTRKNNSSIQLEEENKPLIQIMGESLPFFKSLNDGTNRRFLLVPKVSNTYIEFIKDKDNEQIKKEFFDILYKKPIQCLSYYSQKIKELDLMDNFKNQKIIQSMEINLKDLENLLEDKEEIFSRYFNLEPLGKFEDESNNIRYILDVKSLGLLLEYIDNYIITVSHFANSSLRKKYLRNLIKDHIGKNIGDLGKVTDKNGINYFYYYTLTPEGVELLNKINNDGIYETKLKYYNG